jgi:hypothetical protein
VTHPVGWNVNHLVFVFPSTNFSLDSFGGFSPLAVTSTTFSGVGRPVPGRVPIRPVNQFD